MGSRTATNDAAVPCQGPQCKNRFVPERSTARYCSGTCRQRAARDRKAARASGEADETAGKAEHPLVRAVRNELSAASRLETFNGQLALQLARRLAGPDESAATALSKELRAVMAAALDSAAPPEEPGDPANDEDDEVKRAREARERKARDAAAH